MSWKRRLFRLALGRRLARTSGSLRVPGIASTLHIARDGYGVPQIRAACDEDAWFGLGFCQGQDRSFQLELLQRLVRGELAALFGKEALPVDRLTRRIGFWRAAARRREMLRADLARQVEAFARGVNAGRRVGCRRVAHEFAILRRRPTEFTPEDAGGVLSFLSFVLASNWDSEIARLKIWSLDGADALRAVDPAPYPDDFPLPDGSRSTGRRLVDALEGHLEALSRFASTGGASNNWALDSTRTATGRPLLANDPHLAPNLPAHWYLAHLETPDWRVAGASVVGGPAFAAGHNGFCAWGITAGLIDNTDLFIEELDETGTRTQGPEGEQACEVREELIEVRRGQNVVERVIETPRGPVISDALAVDPLEGMSSTSPGRLALSLRAVWLDDAPVDGLLSVHRARDLESFRRAFEEWPALPLNLVYADTDDRILWQLVGEAPVRRFGTGALPLPASHPESGWEEHRRPFSELPWREGSPEGFLATANTAPVSGEEALRWSVDFLDGFRLERIGELLRERRDWDVDSTLAVQLDLKTRVWSRLRERVLVACRETDDLASWAGRLESWNGQLDVDSIEAAVYEFFLARLVQRVARERAPRSAEFALGRGFTPLLPATLLGARRAGHLLELLRDADAAGESAVWNQAIAESLREALAELEERFGAEDRAWQWGSVRQVRFRHALGVVPALGAIFDRGPYPLGGDSATIAQAAAPMADPGVDAAFTVSLRMVVDVGNWNASRFVLPGGQSGNPLSPHYDDQLELWRNGGAIPIAWDRREVERATRQRLVLEPDAASSDSPAT